MAAQTIIGSTIVIEGEVKCGEDVAIEGRINGKIQTTADLFVEANGTIEAEVETRNITVHGTVNGNVRASDKYELMNDARVTGDVIAPRVVIADGASFKGNIDMAEGGSSAERAEQATPLAKKPLKR